MNVASDIHELLRKADEEITDFEFNIPLHNQKWMESTAQKIEALIQERVEERLLEEARNGDHC